LKKAKRVIEGVAGRIESFRAPMLRINEDTVRALEETGFLCLQLKHFHLPSPTRLAKRCCEDI